MRKERKEIIFPYHIVTPVLLVVLLLWPQLKALYAWWQRFSWSMIPMVPISLSVLGFVFVFIGLQVYYHVRTRKEWRTVQVIPSNQVTVTPKQVEAFVLDLYQRHRPFWRRLLRGREWFGFLIHTNAKNQILFYLCYPQDKQTGVKRTIQSHFPACRLRDIPRSQLPLPDGEQPFGGGHFAMNRRGKRAGLPLQHMEESQLGSILQHMAPQTWLWLQFSPDLTQRKLEKRVQRGLKNLGLSKSDLINLAHLDNPTREIREMLPMERARYHSLYRQHTGREKSFQVAMSLWVQREGHDVNVFVQDTKSSIERVMEGDNYVYLRKQWLLPKRRHPLFQPIPHRGYRMTWSHTEVANLLHVPDGQESLYQLPQPSKEYRPTIQTQFFSEREFTQGIKVGVWAEDPTRAIHIPYSQWTYMAFGAGGTGFGKSALFLMMMYSLLEHWYTDPSAPGFTYIDPKGDSALKLLSKIRTDLQRLSAQRIDIAPLQQRIHYFDLSSDEYILGLNLLHRDRAELTDQIVDDVMSLLKNAYAQESIWLDKLGQMAIHALLLDDREHSLLGIEQLLRKDHTFRKQVLPAVKGTLYEQDWIDNLEAIQQGHVGLPLMNRMQKIRLNTRMRRLFGQARMDLHPARWMDESHICIFNVSGLTEVERRLAVGYIITRYHQEAKHRSHKAKIHPHFIDEFADVQLPVIERIYAQDRYTGHCLIPMTQHVHQLKREIHHAVDGNAATLIAFNQGSQSAKTISEMAGQQFDPQTLQQLPKRMAWITTRDAHGERISYPVKVDPPYLYDRKGEPTYYGPDEERQQREEGEAYAVARQFGETLMQRDCTPAEEVDRWIEEYVMQGQQHGSEDVRSPDEEESDQEEDGSQTLEF